MNSAPTIPTAALIANGTFHRYCVTFLFSPLLVYIHIFCVHFFLSRLRTFCDKNGRGKHKVYGILCVQLTFFSPYAYVRTQEHFGNTRPLPSLLLSTVNPKRELQPGIVAHRVIALQSATRLRNIQRDCSYIQI
jgi:hypothetical protein